MLKSLKLFFKSQWLLIFVYLVNILAIILIIFERWRKGTLLIGLSIIFLGVITLFSNEGNKILEIRSKKFDSYFYIILGILISYLSFTVSALGT